VLYLDPHKLEAGEVDTGHTESQLARTERTHNVVELSLAIPFDSQVDRC
jgi:hypothetical protein